MLYVAVALTGLGGLVIELVLVRRFGLLLGNTSEASALVIGTYLLGLGVGGLLVPALVRKTHRPLLAAAGLYATVAVSSLALDLLLQRTPPLSLSAGLAMLLLIPGFPTLLMGMAFPLVFAGIRSGTRRIEVGALVGANLAGSLVGAALAANVWIPELGARASAGLAAAAYAVAALLLGVSARTQPRWPESTRTDPLPRLGRLAVASALSGLLVVGLQILLLRRLPFFLEGFQPTLSGVLGACLLGLTAGSMLGTPLLATLFRDRAVPAAILLAAFALNLGLQEHVVPSLSNVSVSTELGLHVRVWLCALVAAGAPCFLLGATVPLCVSRFSDPAVRSALAGRLFFWQGVGSVVGSLLVGEALPALWPEAFFVAVPLALVGVSVPALFGWRCRLGGGAVLAFALAAALLGWSGPGTLRAPAPPLARPHGPTPPGVRYVAHRTDSTLTASAVYDRSRHSMVLYTNEFRAAETGPFAEYMHVLGHLPFLLRRDLDEVAVIAFGTGTTAKAVTLWSEPSEIHLVEISRAVLALAPHFGGDGPLPEPRNPAFLEDPRSKIQVSDGRRFLALREPASLDLITMEPLLPYSPGTASLYTREFYALAARVLTPRGILVQWVPTHAVPPSYYASLLATFARSFVHCSVWFVNGATILVGSQAPHLPSVGALEGGLRTAPEAARLGLHAAGLAGAADLVAAFVGDDLLAVAERSPVLSDDRPFVERVGIWKYDGTHLFFYKRNFALLTELAAVGGSGPLHGEEWTRVRVRRLEGYRGLTDATRAKSPLASARSAAREFAAARRILPESVLLFGEETLALRFAAELELAGRRGRNAGELVRRHLTRDPGSAMLQAALALPDPGGEAALSAEAAAARAVAIAPLFFESAPEFLAHLAPASFHTSPLEEIGVLPAGPTLAAMAVGEEPLAVGLRAAYRVRVARAFLEVLSARPLDPEERRALAPLLDPVLLAQAVDVVRRRGGSLQDEVVPLGREDLPLPTELDGRRVSGFP